jgi:hypothetical protein
MFEVGERKKKAPHAVGRAAYRGKEKLKSLRVESDGNQFAPLFLRCNRSSNNSGEILVSIFSGTRTLPETSGSSAVTVASSHRRRVPGE